VPRVGRVDSGGLSHFLLNPRESRRHEIVDAAQSETNMLCSRGRGDSEQKVPLTKELGLCSPD
jgi:hypothetical protein